MKNSQKLYYFIFFLMTVLLLLQIILSNRLTEDGRRLKKIQAEINKLEEDNSSLVQQIAAQGGLIRLTLVAKEKGFVKASQVINLSGKIPVAAYSR